MGNSTQQEMARQALRSYRRKFQQRAKRGLSTDSLFEAVIARFGDAYKAAVRESLPAIVEKQIEPKKQVALVGWGLRHDLGEGNDPADGIIMDMLEKKGYDVHIINGNLQPQYGVAYHIKTRKLVHAQRISDLKVRGDIAKQLKGLGIKTAVFFVARSNQELQLAWGDLSIAGIKLWLVPIEGFNSTPMPCTMRYKGEKEIGSHPFEAGSWVKHQVAGVTAYRWKEPRWTFDELAATTFPFGSVIMWKASDYDEMWQPVFVADVMEETIREANQTAWTGLDLLNRRYFRLLEKYSMCQQAIDHTRPLSPPEGISYPHILNLEGYRFCEVPLRYIDYLAGQNWIYGEFAQRLRQYHAHPLIQEELKKFTPDTETVGGIGVPSDRRNLESDSTGYWDNHDRYVQTMCQGPPQWNPPVLLTPKDRFGKPLKGRAAYNETLTDHVARRLEELGYDAILHEEPAWRWTQVVPWAFDEYDRSGDGRIASENIQVTLDLDDEEPDFQRDPSKQRFPYHWQPVTDEMYTQEDAKAEEKATRNAWYTALDLSEQLAHTKDRAKGAQTPEHWNGERQGTAKAEPLSERLLGIERDLEAVIREANLTCWTDLLRPMRDYYRLQEVIGLYVQDSQTTRKQSLLEEFRDVTLQVTPLLIRMLGSGVREWLYQQAKEVLAEVRAAARHSHQSPYIQQIMEVLEEHPETASKLLEVSKVMPDVVEEILQACPEFATKELQDSIKATYKRRSRLFPELYTKKGKRRVTPTYEKVTA